LNILIVLNHKNMPPFSNLMPFIPASIIEVTVYVVAILGTILLTYAVFLKKEKRQDVILLLGALCLLIYALYINNTIFVVAMAGLAMSSLTEWLEIVFGLHKDMGDIPPKKL